MVEAIEEERTATSNSSQPLEYIARLVRLLQTLMSSSIRYENDRFITALSASHPNLHLVEPALRCGSAIATTDESKDFSGI